MTMDEPRECPKCHHVRRKGETAPAWQCPRCGVAYDKAAQGRPARGGTGEGAAQAGDGLKPRSRFKTLRIWVLMSILVLVGLDTWLTKVRSTSWDHPLRVVVYPINGDGSEAAARYIERLDAARFEAIEQLVKTEAARYGVAIEEPMNIDVAGALAESPPLPPKGGNVFEIMWWSLKLRLWANAMDDYDGPAPEVRAFTLFYDPATHPVLEHSTGLEKGMIGVIKLFASNEMTVQNDTVMLHELLHTLGATDKYDLNTNQPLYPEGYAEPDLQPRLPQSKAEVMAGRIPLSAARAEMPERFEQVIVGPVTAREIGWIE